MAVRAILPQPASPAPSDPVLSALASALTHTHAADPLYGIPFSRALGRAVEHAENGVAYEPYNATHYRVQSGSRAWLWYYTTLDQCSCEARGPWCWHRALLHLLTARAALQTLDRCPRPAFVQLAPSKTRDYAAVLREADELY